VNDFERHGRHHAGIVRQRGLGDQNQELAVLQARDDFACGLLARKLTEKFFDVLNFERAGFEGVLLDEVFQSVSIVPGRAAVSRGAAAAFRASGAADSFLSDDYVAEFV
jgi:hypothetical protein